LEEEKIQQQLKAREEKYNQVSRALGKFLDEINFSQKGIESRDVDTYIQNLIQEFGSDFMIKCPKCNKDRPIELKVKNLLKHLNRLHQ
jgi:DNA repair exonuclease SbcCD ATPase subunit